MVDIVQLRGNLLEIRVAAASDNILSIGRCSRGAYKYRSLLYESPPSFEMRQKPRVENSWVEAGMVNRNDGGKAVDIEISTQVPFRSYDNLS